MNTLILIIFIIQLFLIGNMIYLYLSKKRNIVNTLLYFISIFVINFIINIASLNYYKDLIVFGGYDIKLFDVLTTLLNSIKVFLFGSNIEQYHSYLAQENSLYAIVYMLGIFMGVSMTLFTALDVFKLKLFNYIKVNQTLKNKCDIVYGNLNSCKKYANNSKNTLIWVSNLDKEQINCMLNEGYLIIHKEFNVLNLKKITKTNIKYNFIYFDVEKESYKEIEIFAKYINNNDNISFYIEVDENKKLFINNFLLKNSDIARFITTFSLDELIIDKFVEENPFTLRIPTSFINEDTTFNNSKKINVFMIGQDKFNQELLKQLVLNNQFAKYENNEYLNALVNYHVYDNKKILNDFNLFKRISSKYGKLNREEFFDLPGEIANINFKESDISTSNIIDDILSITNDENSYNFIFINENHLNLYKIINEESSKNNIFYYIRTESNIENRDVNSFIYGDKDELISHDIIINDKLHKLAIAVYANYNKISSDEAINKWLEINDFEKQSNIFASKNLRFKLNLLGLDYKKGSNKENILDTLHMQIKNINNFDYYENRNIVTALIAQEHLRWNAFHIINGFIPLKKSELKLNSNLKFKTKDLEKKEHIYLTSYKGLKDITNRQYEMMKIKQTDVKIENFDVYKYDLMLMQEANKILSSLEYKIIKK